MATKVALLTVVAIMANPTANPGIRRFAMKYSLVVVWRRAVRIAMAAVAAR